MRFSLRAKRVLVGAAAGALALGLMPVGAATASTGPVCENAPASPFVDKGTTHGANIDCMYYFEVPGDEDDAFAGQRIIAGTSGTTFEPFANMTRGQAATVIVKFGLVATDRELADGLSEELPNFDDIEGNTHELAIRIAADLGLIQGYGDGNFGPNDTLQRAQFAAILFEAHEALGVPFEDEYENPFTDVDRRSVSALAAVGVVSGKTPTMFDPWAPLQRGQAMSMLALSAEVLFELDLWAPGVIPPQDGLLPSYLDAPELVGVSFVDDNDTRTQIDFIFDEPVQPEFVSAQTFYMIGWNGAQIFADVQDLRRQDEVFAGGADNIVRVAFRKAAGRYANTVQPEFGAQFQFGTTPRGYADIVGAGVAADAVLGEDTDLNNPPQSIGLQGSTVPADFTYAPYIVDVAVSAAQNTVTLQMVNGSSLTDPLNTTRTALTLWFNDNRGFDYDGDNVGPVDAASRRVARSFAYPQADLAFNGVTQTLTLDLEPLIGNLSSSDAANLAHVTLEPGVVARPAAQNTLQSIPVASGTNGVTPDPDLIDYTLDYTNDRVVFTFSETVTDRVVIRDTDDVDNFEVFDGVPEFFQVHYVSSEHRADLLRQPWIAFPGAGARHNFGEPVNRDLYFEVLEGAALPYSGVVRGTDILDVSGNQVTVQFPASSITKDITRVSVVSWMDAPDSPGDQPGDPFGLAALRGLATPQLADFADADGDIRERGFPETGRYGVGAGQTVNISDLADALDVLVADDVLSVRGYGAIYASDGSGAPNVRMSLSQEQVFAPLETIGPDPLDGSFDVVQRDNIDDSPQRYRIDLPFDAVIRACDETNDLLENLNERDRRNPQHTLTSPSGDGVIVSLWEEDGSRTRVNCGQLRFDAGDNTNAAIVENGTTLRLWAGNNPQTDVFTLNEIIDARIISLEFGSVDTRGGLTGKPGLRNYGTNWVLDTE